jgi:arabinogalactan oligomer/maltooligosaccharide transport system substrate-binding protein
MLVALLTLTSLLLAACGGQGSTGSQATAPAAATAAPAAATAAPAPATAASAATSEATAPAATEAPTAAPDAQPTEQPTEAPVALGTGGTKIVVWHGWDGAYREAIQQIFAEYAQKNNVTIELVKQADLSNKAQVAVPSGQGPDIIAWVDDQIGKNALSNIIQPVDQYGITADYLKENFTQVAADAMVYDGKPYGVPESMEALTFIYNKKLITQDKLPKSTDDLIKQAEQYAKDNAGKYLFVYNAKNDAYFSAPWWLGAGVTLVTPNGTTELGSDKAVKAGELIKSFTTIMPKEIDYNVADSLFKEGKAAIIMNGPWSIADYQKAGLDIGLATIPVVSSSGQPGKPFVGVKMLMLAVNAKQPQAAADLMKYYGTAEVQAKLAQINKQVPANKKAQDEVKSDPIIAGFIAQASNGVPMPNTQFIDAMWDPISKTVEAIWTGASAPDQATKDGAALFEEKAKDLK